jgi:1,4-dihydroxy-2-naphthoate octaprenyltransferase
MSVSSPCFFSRARLFIGARISLSRMAARWLGWSSHLLIAGAICSCLIGASYPLTQVYQHQEDSQRGDRTLSLLLGYKGSFMSSQARFVCHWLATDVFVLATNRQPVSLLPVIPDYVPRPSFSFLTGGFIRWARIPPTPTLKTPCA